MARNICLVAVLVLALACTASARRPPPRRTPPPRPPPPSPSPPPPPSPPSSFEYPHSCKPGNIVSNGQGAGIACTPYKVTVTGSAGSTISFAVAESAPTKTCTRVRNTDCSVMNLADVKFAINTACWGAVQNFQITDSVSTYTRSPVYGRESYPVTNRPGMTARVVFPTAYTTANVTGLRFTMNIRTNALAECRTPRALFATNNGFTGVQYGYFSVNKVCCGTEVASF